MYRSDVAVFPPSRAEFEGELILDLPTLRRLSGCARHTLLSVRTVALTRLAFLGVRLGLAKGADHLAT